MFKLLFGLYAGGFLTILLLCLSDEYDSTTLVPYNHSFSRIYALGGARDVGIQILFWLFYPVFLLLFAGVGAYDRYQNRRRS